MQIKEEIICIIAANIRLLMRIVFGIPVNDQGLSSKEWTWFPFSTQLVTSHQTEQELDRQQDLSVHLCLAEPTFPSSYDKLPT